MSSHDNTSNEHSSEVSSDIAIPPIVRFWIILPLYIPSLLCSLFALYHFVFNRTLRQAAHNHVIILLLFMNFIIQLLHIPWLLNYYLTGTVWIQTPAFCLIWIFTDESLFITTTVLFAWATIERHILIFHDQLVATKNKLILFHYLPTVIIILYCICYNIIAVLVPPCENIFDYTQAVCGSPLCYYENRLLAVWDVIVNDIIPAIIIIVCSLTLLLRVLYQKYRMHQAIRWRNHRKMMIQLLSISVLYLVIYIPEMIMEVFYLCGVSEEIGSDFMLYAAFFGHYGYIFLPFVCAGSIPELKTKLQQLFPCRRCRQRRAVGPETLSRRTEHRQVPVTHAMR